MSVLQLAQVCTQLHNAYQRVKKSDKESKQYRLIYADCWKITNELVNWRIRLGLHRSLGSLWARIFFSSHQSCSIPNTASAPICSSDFNGAMPTIGTRVAANVPNERIKKVTLYEKKEKTWKTKIVCGLSAKYQKSDKSLNFIFCPYVRNIRSLPQPHSTGNQKDTPPPPPLCFTLTLHKCSFATKILGKKRERERDLIHTPPTPFLCHHGFSPRRI